MGKRNFSGLLWYCCVLSLHYFGIIRSQPSRLNYYDTGLYNNSGNADYYPVQPSNPITYVPQPQRASNGSYIIRILLPNIVRSNTANYRSPSNCSGSPSYSYTPTGSQSYAGYNFPKRRWYPYNEAPVYVPQYNAPPERPYMPHQQDPQVAYQAPQHLPNLVPQSPPYQVPQPPPGSYQPPPVDSYSQPKGPYLVPVPPHSPPPSHSPPVPPPSYLPPVPPPSYLPPPPEQPVYSYNATTTRAKDYVTPAYYETTAAYYPEHYATKQTYAPRSYDTMTTPYPPEVRYETTKAYHDEPTSRKYSPTKRYRRTTTMAYKTEEEYERPTNGTVYEEYQPEVKYKPRRLTTTKRPVKRIPRTTPKPYEASGEEYELIPTKRTTKKVVYRRKPKLPANEEAEAGE